MSLSESLRFNFRIHFVVTSDFTSISLSNSLRLWFRIHFRIHFDVTFEFTSSPLRFHTRIHFNVKDTIFPGDKRYDLSRLNIKDTGPTGHFFFPKWHDGHRGHARPNRNDFPVPGGCWLALSPPNLRWCITQEDPGSIQGPLRIYRDHLGGNLW